MTKREGWQRIPQERNRALVKRKTSFLIIVLLMVTLMAGSAAAHKVDVVKAGKRLGPIHLFETTLDEAKSWFGSPTGRRTVQLGCIQAIRVKWGRKLMVFFDKSKDHVAIQGEIRRRHLRSAKHGVLRPHTVKGLRVKDSHRKLRRLYPNADAFRHGGHYDYFLRSSPHRGKLVAITEYKRGHVRRLFAGPYETC